MRWRKREKGRRRISTYMVVGSSLAVRAGLPKAGPGGQIRPFKGFQGIIKYSSWPILMQFNYLRRDL